MKTHIIYMKFRNKVDDLWWSLTPNDDFFPYNRVDLIEVLDNAIEDLKALRLRADDTDR